MDHPLYKPLLAASITTSSFLVGCQLSLSHVTIPTILGPPHVGETAQLKQFRTVFWRGFQLCPSSALLSSLCCFANAGLVVRRVGLSSLTPSIYGRVPRLLLAGSLMIGLVPYTIAFILPVEDPLLEREAVLSKTHALGNGHAEKTEDSSEDTLALIKKCNFRNYIRAMIPALGVAVAWSLF